MSRMHNPPHPGELVKATLIDSNNLSVTAAAANLGVTRVSLSKLINCRSGLSPEMAIRLSIELNTSAEMWLNLQKEYDLWCAEKTRNKIKQQMEKSKKASMAHFKMRSKVKTTRAT